MTDRACSTRHTVVTVMLWSGLAYVGGIVVNWVTFFAYGGMPVPWGGVLGTRLDSRHVVGHSWFGDNIRFPPGWNTSVGDWFVVAGGIVLWVATSVYLVGRLRASRAGASVCVHGVAL